MCTGVPTSWHTYGSQKTTFWCQFFCFTMWVLVVELRLPGLAAGAFIHWTILPVLQEGSNFCCSETGCNLVNWGGALVGRGEHELDIPTLQLLPLPHANLRASPIPLLGGAGPNLGNCNASSLLSPVSYTFLQDRNAQDILSGEKNS